MEIDLTRQSTSAYVQEFIKAMNDRARALNLTSTRFSNPHGLQNALNQSTPRDLVKLSRNAVKHSLFRGIVNSRTYQYSTYPDLDERVPTVKRWTNTNRLLWEGWEGIKTGCTPAAGNCLASLKEGVFIVVLNCQNDSSRFSDTEKIYAWYQGHTEKHSVKSALVTRPQTELNIRRTTKTEPSF